MAFETRISDCKRYIHTIVTADVSYDLALAFMQRAFNEAMAHGIRNFLYDVRGARNIENTQNNYKLLTTEAVRIGFDRASKIGILIDHNDDSHDFIETAATSVGFNCKIFTSEASLLEWIQI